MSNLFTGSQRPSVLASLRNVDHPDFAEGLAHLLTSLISDLGISRQSLQVTVSLNQSEGSSESTTKAQQIVNHADQILEDIEKAYPGSIMTHRKITEWLFPRNPSPC